MLKVIIIDDEYYFRQSLKKMVNWEACGCEIAGEASNGEDGLVLAEKADIALVDINMPVIDGIEFCRRVNETGRNIKIIMITVYSEFAYAQQALRYGVSDYLLKPVEIGELEKALQNVSALIQTKQYESDVLELVRIKNREQFQNNISRLDIDKLLYALVTNDENVSFVFPSMKRMDLLIALRSGDIEGIRMLTGQAVDKCTAPEQLYILLIELSSVGMEFCHENDSALKNGSGICQEIQRVLEESYTVGQIKEWLMNQFEEALQCCQISKKPRKKQIIEEVKNYIQGNYSKYELSVQKISAEFFINYQYLCKIFKQQTGMTINDYITSIRIRKAKEMMDAGCSVIFEVAAKTGYEDANYFSKCFKKHVGIPPTSYIKNKK